jgi:hypothetical protein
MFTISLSAAAPHLEIYQISHPYINNGNRSGFSIRRFSEALPFPQSDARRELSPSFTDTPDCRIRYQEAKNPYIQLQVAPAKYTITDYFLFNHGRIW